MKIVIGNKLDLEKQRAVKTEEGVGMGRQLGATFLETSAKDGANIEKVFESLALYGVDRVRGRVTT